MRNVQYSIIVMFFIVQQCLMFKAHFLILSLIEH